jgi:flagellar hook-basal body complex protein FliE
MAIAPIDPISVQTMAGGATPLRAAPAAPVGGPSFTQLVDQGLQGVEDKVARADALMKAFAMGDPIPVHQVTIALEEARLAVEMSVQVRERLTETYRSFMNMQL